MSMPRNGGICMFRGCHKAASFNGTCLDHMPLPSDAPRAAAADVGLVDRVINMANSTVSHYANNPLDGVNRVTNMAVSHFVPVIGVVSSSVPLLSGARDDIGRAQSDFANQNFTGVILSVASMASRVLGVVGTVAHVPFSASVGSAVGDRARAFRPHEKTD